MPLNSASFIVSNTAAWSLWAAYLGEKPLMSPVSGKIMDIEDIEIFQMLQTVHSRPS